MKNLLPVILMLTGMIVQSCADCGPQAELSATIRFRGDSLKLDSVYALHAVSQEAITRQLKDALNGSNYQISLPLSLTSDTTTYVFRFTGQTDTLSIYYQRLFRYKGGCGFINDALEPTSGSHYYSTFSKTNIHYGTYVLPGEQPWLGHDPGAGIVINVEL
ncbi:MAG: hypothetical protein J7619_16265 [Dyadobacter sp.]|uniref:hypothetical protein n=1 Tax=Dyadobacter sp. TaxID=1914288 RepID=UPI001B24E929|nr:hypothetical protein [Dyadobacter sp.]MBO9614260.1 hypothetical protein [Dyadobacter sp.]